MGARHGLGAARAPGSPRNLNRRGLWTRGLPTKLRNPLSQADGLEGKSYASGGPFTADPRLRKVAFAVVACQKSKKEGQGYVQVGAIAGMVPGAGKTHTDLWWEIHKQTAHEMGSIGPPLEEASK